MFCIRQCSQNKVIADWLVCSVIRLLVAFIHSSLTIQVHHDQFNLQHLFVLLHEIESEFFYYFFAKLHALGTLCIIVLWYKLIQQKQDFVYEKGCILRLIISFIKICNAIFMNESE